MDSITLYRRFCRDQSSRPSKQHCWSRFTPGWPHEGWILLCPASAPSLEAHRCILFCCRDHRSFDQWRGTGMEVQRLHAQSNGSGTCELIGRNIRKNVNFESWNDNEQYLLIRSFWCQQGATVLSWKSPETEMVAYRSFNPFFPLLEAHVSPHVQLWAVWAIHHVCSKNRECFQLDVVLMLSRQD